MKLLTTQNAKTTRGNAKGYLTGILYMNPEKLCPWSSPGCRAGCLYTAGRGAFKSIQLARTKKAQWYLKDKASFILQLDKDIEALKRKAKRQGMLAVVRLNGTSDVIWPAIAPELFEKHADVIFYDYSKAPVAVFKKIPSNYSVTFSYSETMERSMLDAVLGTENNLAVVFKGSMLPASYLGRPVVDGTIDDLRFLDAKKVIVGLLAKGKAKKDSTGFAVTL